MSDITLYNVLKRIPNTTDEEAREAVKGHGDLRWLEDRMAKVEDRITKLEGRITKLEADVSAIKWMVGLLLAINVAFIVSAVGMMINFL